MECLGVDTFLVMPSVLLSGGMKIRDEHGMLRGYTFLVMTAVRRSGGMKNKEQGDRRQRTGQRTDDRR